MTKQEELKMMAIGLGACDKGLDNWEQAPTDSELIGRWIRHIDFAIKHDYPSREYIKNNFDKDTLHKCGVMIDENVEVLPNGIVVLNGECKGVLNYSFIDSQTLHIRHECDVEINTDMNSCVFVKLYDKARLKIKTEKSSKVYVYQHGGEIASIEGNVIVHERRKEVAK